MCNHIIRCAVTPDEREVAVAYARDNYALGMMMLNGPCVPKRDEAKYDEGHEEVLGW